MLKSEIKAGMKVHYVDTFSCKCENGIVKNLHSKKDAAFVVYHCGGEWDDYYNYTGALTMLRDLYPGWRKQSETK